VVRLIGIVDVAATNARVLEKRLWDTRAPLFSASIQ